MLIRRKSNKREQNSSAAVLHNNKMIAEYSQNTIESIKNSVIYSNEINRAQQTAATEKPNIKIVNGFTQDFISNNPDKKFAVLNFASYLHPGGGFMSGSMAQEEALCHHSNLYNALVDFYDVYSENRKTTNNGLYTNWAIYSPDIVFDGDVLANVITCPAPNYNAYTNKNGVHDYTIAKARLTMFSRCKFVLDILEANNNKDIVLGAFGCGVFGNDPVYVATCFKTLLPSYSFRNIYFVIPSGPNLEAFKRIFG